MQKVTGVTLFWILIDFVTEHDKNFSDKILFFNTPQRSMEKCVTFYQSPVTERKVLESHI